MSVNLLSAVSILLLFRQGCVLGQIVSPGSCPAHQTQMPFNPGQVNQERIIERNGI